MSRLSLALALALLFALPTSSQARHPHPRASEGCLVVADGQGSVTVAARGGIFGRFDMGQVIVDELRPGAANNPQVSGAQEVQTLGQTRTRYVGDNVRFRYEGGGQFRLTLTAIGIELSAVGRGYAILSGRGFVEPGTYSADAGSLCASNFKPLPRTPTKVLLGGQPRRRAGTASPRARTGRALNGSSRPNPVSVSIASLLRPRQRSRESRSRLSSGRGAAEVRVERDLLPAHPPRARPDPRA